MDLGHGRIAVDVYVLLDFPWPSRMPTIEEEDVAIYACVWQYWLLTASQMQQGAAKHKLCPRPSFHLPEN